MFHFFGESQKVLEDLGFDRKAVEYEVFKGESASSKKVSQRILKEVQEGKHGTLVIGQKIVETWWDAWLLSSHIANL